jgi:hypothetical protein
MFVSLHFVDVINSWFLCFNIYANIGLEDQVEAGRFPSP